jgi:hypothetical protein
MAECSPLQKIRKLYGLEIDQKYGITFLIDMKGK